LNYSGKWLKNRFIIDKFEHYFYPAMKNLKKESLKANSIPNFTVIGFWVLFFLFLYSCAPKPEPYSIIEFKGGEDVGNYSKSLYLAHNKADSIQPVFALGEKGDLFMSGEFLFWLSDTATQTRFLFQYDDSILTVNGKIYSINIPDNDNMIPWMKNIKGEDLSALQIIRFESKIRNNYIPYLIEMSVKTPNAGIVYNGEMRELTELLKIFHPKFIGGTKFRNTDYDLLAGMDGTKILMITPGDSLVNGPLPPMPSLDQLFLTEMSGNKVLPNNLLVNNRQLKRVVMEEPGNLDLSILAPLDNLKELVVTGADTILHFDLINNHRKLEVLSIATEDRVFDPSLIKLPSLRWLMIPSFVTQQEFDLLTASHPALEVMEIFKNDTIHSLQSLTKLPGLYALTVMDTVMDMASLKKLLNLKYLSLPDKCLKDSLLKADLHKSLPGTRIVANEGFCLGSGWLLLLIPLILVFRFITLRRKQILQEIK
jgi:hypothetical protein